jgi:hypothetical protein
VGRRGPDPSELAPKDAKVTDSEIDEALLLVESGPGSAK